MTKSEIITEIQLMLSGGDPSAQTVDKYDYRVIEKACELMYDDIITNEYAKGTLSGDMSVLDLYSHPYFVTVQYDQNRLEKFVELPILVIPLKGNAGIRQVSPKNQQSLAFAYMEMNSQSVWNELEADSVMSIPSYYVEDGFIFFNEKISPSLTDILLKLVEPFSALKDTDDVFLAGNNKVFVQSVYEIVNLENKNPRQDINDGTSKQV